MASKKCFIILVCMLGYSLAQQEPLTAAELVSDVYHSCLKYYKVSCVKSKALQWLTSVKSNNVIRITDELSIRTTRNLKEDQERASYGGQFQVLDKIEDFIASHELHITVPDALKPNGALGEFVPRSLIPEDVSIPLTSEGRSKKKSGLMRKVIIPFLLGLKFKAGVIVPLALALIAVKTWKALTLGLLSLVLSGALVIFKFTKPKIVNYEVIHYPHHVDHHVDHVETPAPAGWDHQGYGRTIDAQELAYSGYTQ